MSRDAMLACIVCGEVLRNVWEDGNINQPSEGTEFATYGHYGSTFWDSFAGEEIVINVCDECLEKNVDRVGRRKRYRKLVVRDDRGPIPGALTVVGRQWVEREMVPYFDGPEDEDDIEIEIEQIGLLDRRGHGHYERIEWVSNWRETKANLLKSEALADGIEDPKCLHTRHVAECVDCGATPLEGLR